ncbi:hypothetical protein GRX03_06895 [Halovenus sp. WSH3]|uniref:Response regulator receiver protein n=1 Tax=Halovenus carboxidivorans TaxID=2692199 RepID=A0A6B0T7R0_9EURY|nr:hypothetical protein [Halovenus carboxidivorans]MXR51332.1 hypothetical protein [Halovenus carboxidivorans]
MTDVKSALVVTYNEKDADLLGGFLGDQGYAVTGVSSLSAFDAQLSAPEQFDFALVDADGFPPAVWERCEQLQRAAVPFLVLSLNPDQVSAGSEAETNQPVLEKPIQKADLLGLIDSMTD